ncbi:aminotransferase class I/II-fold pyridoxal phosphate-dependent enzyme [Patescibacteria group bacterium]|nr:aminotransferase class I/II-fold pyridoxal phosphate-dependent enzyme [Patescibacteria group bacterium]MBU1123199.1 aminotransferase class I/II-fold pyridoxal phosphate-dependent enzyme [Patescibacteria group bacterium]
MIILAPWKWRRGKSQTKLESELSKKFNADCFLFSSGRESLCALLRAMKLQNGEEVIVQSYTCVAVPNAIHAAGGVPVYADIDRETLNLTPEDCEAKITNHTRAIICQHTFGIPSDTKALREICDRHNIVLIEDCAHIMPDESGPESVCTRGDFIFFSFGRDKAISGITGGAILSRNNYTSLQLRAERARAEQLSYFTILRLLSYPFIYFIARPFYGLFFGKALLFSLKKIGWMVPILTDKEKEGDQSPIPCHLPNACAYLALTQLKKLKKLNDHRRKLTKVYLDQYSNTRIFPSQITTDLPLQKFPLFIHNADEIRSKLKQKNIHLSDGWTGCVVCPEGIDLDPTNYTPGSDPMAEAACEKIMSLPTHPSMSRKQAKKLIKVLMAQVLAGS